MASPKLSGKQKGSERLGVTKHYPHSCWLYEQQWCKSLPSPSPPHPLSLSLSPHFFFFFTHTHTHPFCGRHTAVLFSLSLCIFLKKDDHLLPSALLPTACLALHHHPRITQRHACTLSFISHHIHRGGAQAQSNAENSIKSTDTDSACCCSEWEFGLGGAPG